MFGIFESDDNDDGDDGCTGHHFGEWLRHQEFRFMTTVYGRKLQQKQYRECQHVGCNEAETRWTTLAKVSTEDIDEFVEQLREKYEEEGEEGDDDE